MTRLQITVEQFEAHIRGAYVEGYVQGASHTPGDNVIVRARELAYLFWRLVEGRLVYEDLSASSTDTAQFEFSDSAAAPTTEDQ